MAGLNRVTPGTGITSAWGNSVAADGIRKFTSLAAAQALITAAGITPADGELIWAGDVQTYYRYRASGAVWLPVTASGPGARLYATGNTALGTAAMTDIALAAESYDPGGRATPGTAATARYSVPFTGLYDVRFRVSITTPNATEIFAAVRIGASTEILRSDRIRNNSGAVADMAVVGSDIYPLTAGDLVKLSAYCSAAGATAGAATVQETFLTVHPK